MNRKILGVIIGVIGIILWFMPLVSWQQEFMGNYVNLYQAGYHIGGIAYLLLLAMFAYAVFSWLQLHELRMIAGAVALLICLLFFFQVLKNAGWALIGLIILSIIGVVIALSDYKKNKAKINENP